MHLNKLILGVLMMFYFLDFLINLNTAVMYKGILIFRRAIIAKNYIKSKFIYDIFAIIIPLIIEYNQT